MDLNDILANMKPPQKFVPDETTVMGKFSALEKGEISAYLVQISPCPCGLHVHAQIQTGPNEYLSCEVPMPMLSEAFRNHVMTAAPEWDSESLSGSGRPYLKLTIPEDGNGMLTFAGIEVFPMGGFAPCAEERGGAVRVSGYNFQSGEGEQSH